MQVFVHREFEIYASFELILTKNAYLLHPRDYYSLFIRTPAACFKE